MNKQTKAGNQTYKHREQTDEHQREGGWRMGKVGQGESDVIF